MVERGLRDTARAGAGAAFGAAPPAKVTATTTTGGPAATTQPPGIAGTRVL